MSKMFGIIKHYYDAGLWTKTQVWNAVLKGKITEEEYHLIVDGEPDAAQAEPETTQAEPETTQAEPEDGGADDGAEADGDEGTEEE